MVKPLSEMSLEELDTLESSLLEGLGGLSSSEESVLERAERERYAGGNALTRGLSRGVDVAQMGYGSALEGLGKVAGLEGLQQYGGDVVAEQEQELAAKAPYATRLKDVTEAEGILGTTGALASFTGSALGESLPQMGTTIGGSLAGAAAGARAGSVLGLPGAVAGGIAGGLLANIPFFYGMNREAQKEAIEQGYRTEMNEGAAFLASLPQSTFDLISDRLLVGLGPKVGVNIEKLSRQGGLFTRGAKGAALGATVEVPTEVGQQLIERFQAGMPIDSPEAIDEYIEVMAAAGLVGGSIRGATNVISGDPVAREARERKNREEADEAARLKEQQDAEKAEEERIAAIASGEAEQGTLDFDATDEAAAAGVVPDEVAGVAPEVVPEETATPLDVEVNRHRRNLEQYRTDGAEAEALLLDEIEQLEVDIRAATVEEDTETVAKKEQELYEARDTLGKLRTDEDQFEIGEGIPSGRKARKPKFEYADPTAGLAPELVNEKDQLLDKIYDLKINTPPDADAETLATIEEEIAVKEQAISDVNVQIDAFAKKNRKRIKEERENSAARLKELEAANKPALGVLPEGAEAYETVGGEQVSLFDVPLVEQDRPTIPLTFEQGEARAAGSKLLETGEYVEEDFQNPLFLRNATGRVITPKESGLTVDQIENVKKNKDAYTDIQTILEDLGQYKQEDFREGFGNYNAELDEFSERFNNSEERLPKLASDLKRYRTKVNAQVEKDAAHKRQGFSYNSDKVRDLKEKTRLSNIDIREAETRYDVEVDPANVKQADIRKIARAKKEKTNKAARDKRAAKNKAAAAAEAAVKKKAKKKAATKKATTKVAKKKPSTKKATTKVAKKKPSTKKTSTKVAKKKASTKKTSTKVAKKKASKKKATEGPETVVAADDTQTDPTKINENVEAAPKEGSIVDYFTPSVLKAYEKYAAEGEIPFTYEELKELQAKGLIKVTKTGKILKSTLEDLVKRLETVRKLRDNAEQGVIDAVGNSTIELLEFTEKSAKNSSGSYGELAKFAGQKSVAIEALVSDMMGADTTLDGVEAAKLSMDAGGSHGLKEGNFGAVGRAAASRGEVGAESDSPFKLAFPYTGGKYGLDFFNNLKRDEQLAILNEIAEPLAPVEDAPRGRVQPRKTRLADADEIKALETKRDNLQEDLRIEEKKVADKDKNKIAELEKAIDSITNDIAKKIGYADLEISELETKRDEILAELQQETNRAKTANLEDDLQLILEDIERARYREIDQRADGLEEIRNLAAVALEETRTKIAAVRQKTGFGDKEPKALARLRKEEEKYEAAYKKADKAYVDFVNLQTKYFTATGPEGEVIENSFVEGNPLAATRHGVLSDEKRGLHHLEKPPRGPLQQSPLTLSYDTLAKDKYSIPFEEKVYPKTTVAKTKAVILERLGQAGVDRITVAATPEKAGLTDIEPTAAGVVIDGKPYLFTDNIAEGNELGVLMHEIGVHVGMPTLVGQGNYKFMVNQIREFAKADDGSRESQLAKRALERVKQAGKIVDVNKDDELIAYFVEEAVNSGINPTSARVEKGKLGTFFRRLLAGIKNLISKLPGINFKTYDAQDFVDFAYGGADLAIRNPDRKFTNAERAIQYSVAASIDGGASATPAYAKAKDLMNAPFRSMHNAAPVWSQNVIDTVLSSLSNLPDYLAKVFYNLLSLRQMADTVDRFGDNFKPIAKALRELNDIVNARRFAIDTTRLDFQSALLEAQSHKEGYTQKDLEDFYEIVHESTLEEIDLRSSESKVTSTDLYKRFMKVVNKSSDLNKYDLRKSYKILADTYAQAGQRLLDFYQKSIAQETPLTREQKQKLGFIVDAQGTIVPYFPLMRSGSWWVDIKVGAEPFTMAYKTKREAEQAAKELAKDPEVTLEERHGSVVYNRVRNDELSDTTSGLKMLTQVQAALEKSLATSPQKDQVIAQIKDTILNAYPAQSLKNQFKKRKGTKGFRQDVFQNFADMSLKYSNELALLDNVDSINGKINEIEAFGAEGKVPPAIANVINSVQKRSSFLLNPTPGAISSRFAWGGYTWFILGNISSAIVNLTQIPLVTYGLLAGEFGVTDAAGAIKDGFKAYFKFHQDDNTRLKVLGVPLADRTAFGGKFVDVTTPEGREMKDLFDTALAKGIIRRTTSQELQEAKFGRMDSMTGRVAKTEMALGYVFQNSERANREVSLIAAYKLAKKKYKDKDVAMERAFDIVEQANGPALAEAGPQLFQDSWGKVIGTFKRFALSQLYLQYKLLRDINPLIEKLDKDPKLPEGAPSARSLAIRQYLAISGSAWLFAGAKGMPVYGAAELASNFAQKALGDDEDELDLEFNMKVRKFMGDMAFRGPMSHYLNIDLASRTGFYGLAFRDDPYRRAEVGDFSYFVETLSGPAYAAFVRNPGRAVEKYQNGDLYGAIQTAAPSFIRNAMKGFSLATEGAVNSKGVPIVASLGLYNAMMQILGFTPTTLSNAYQANEFLSRQARKITDRRSKLLLELNIAKNAGDFDGQQELMTEISNFNQIEVVRDTKQQIKGSTMSLSWKNFNRYLDEAVRGLRLPRDMRDGLVRQTGIEDPEDM